MDGRPTWTDCDEAGDYVVPNVLSPRDLVSIPDNMDETVPHTHIKFGFDWPSGFRGEDFEIVDGQRRTDDGRRTMGIL